MTDLLSLSSEARDELKLEALRFACITTAILVTVVLAVAILLVHRKARSAARGEVVGSRSAPPPERFLAYVGSILLWPIGLVMTFIYLRKAATAGYGRNCFVLFATNILLITYPTCIAAFVLGSRYPEFLP